MNTTPSRADRIAQAVRAAFPDAEVSVVDDSARHAGHAGAAPGGETHYRLGVVSQAFRGQGRVDRSRAVNALLANEFAAGLHALNLVLKTPEEVATSMATEGTRA